MESIWLRKAIKHNLGDQIRELIEDKKNKKVGISIYPDKSSFEEIKKYMQLANSYGVKTIFTNLLSDTGNRTKKEIINEFKPICKLAEKLGMDVVADVAPQVFKMLNIDEGDLSFYKEVGFKGIRFDEPFGIKKDVEITHNNFGLLIEFNASDPNLYSKKIIEAGGNLNNITACHNFYPQRYTGLDEKWFLEWTRELKKSNIFIKAFVFTREKETFGPWDEFEGLPTLEIHRDLTIKQQAKYFAATGLVDEILISNCFATEQDFKDISSIDLDVVNLEIDLLPNSTSLEKEIIFDFPHFARPDMSAYMIRSTFPRIEYKNNNIKKRNNKKEFLEFGDVVVLNDGYGRYKGELHIILEKMPNSDDKNLVGKIKKDDLGLIKYITPGRKFLIGESDEN